MYSTYRCKGNRANEDLRRSGGTKAGKSETKEGAFKWTAKGRNARKPSGLKDREEKAAVEKKSGRESKEERKKEKSTEKEKCKELKTELLETAGKTERTHSYQVAKSYLVRYKH